MTDKKTQTEIRKELLQARHRAEEDGEIKEAEE